MGYSSAFRSDVPVARLRSLDQADGGADSSPVSSMLIELITTSSDGRSKRSVLVRVDGVDDVTGRLVGDLTEDRVLAVQVRLSGRR